MQPDQNPYDFIFNGQNKKGKQPFLAGGSKQQRILIAIIFGGIILVLIIAVFSFVFSKGKSNTKVLVSVAQQQNEAIRIAEIGVSKSKDSATRNLAITTKLSLETSQKQLLDNIKQTDGEVQENELNAKKSSATDEALTAAEQSGNFDKEFSAKIREQLNMYLSELKDARSQIPTKSTRAILDSSISQATLLLKE